jgi:hypothetical protein
LQAPPAEQPEESFGTDETLTAQVSPEERSVADAKNEKSHPAKPESGKSANSGGKSSAPAKPAGTSQAKADSDGVEYTAEPPVEEAAADGQAAERTPPPAASRANSKIPPVEGPTFKIPGALAVRLASSLGYQFSPEGGSHPRDANRTSARQIANTVTSEINGSRMIQYQPAAGWTIPKISNTFYMFADGNLRPAPLAQGWKIRGLHLSGPNWGWVGQPASGAPTASFAVMLAASKNSPPGTVVELDYLILEGPRGARDWKAAFVPQNTNGKRRR